MLKHTASIVVSLSLLSSVAMAERYSVEEDSFGSLSAKKVESLSKDSVPESAPSVDVPSIPSPVAKEAPPQASQADVSSEVKVEKETKDQYIGDVGVKLSPFEKAYIERERAEREKAERARVLDAIKKAPRAASDNVLDVDPTEYVDGDELLNSGRRPKEGTRYYTMTDADGRLRNVEYDKGAVQVELDSNQDKIEFTEANILLKSPQKVELPESADPIAVQLLGGGLTSDDYFSSFAKACCENLPNISTTQMELDKSYYFELGDDQLPYRFSGGDSRFLLLTLPETRTVQALKLRSFIRRHKNQNVENGVFFPQLVTLDKDKKPLRIFTGPLLKYHPETWIAHGFLEGFFQIDSTKKGAERYLLVNTTREILQQESSIEDENGLTEIEHMEIGTLELTLVVGEG
jgi:hypothetical protein